MTSLYNMKHDGDQYRCTKFTSDFDVEASYLLDREACECPAGHRPMCRHRDMLPKFLNRQAIGTGWFFDYDRGGWVQGPAQPAASDESLTESTAPAGLDSDPAPQAPTTPAPADSDLLENLRKSNEQLIAEAQPLVLASEASALEVPAENITATEIDQRFAELQGIDNPIAEHLVNETYAAAERLGLLSLPAGVTIIGLDDPALLHNTIADAVGEPSAKINPTCTIRRRI